MRDESAIARHAARQYGLITTVQLRAAGFDKSAISRRVAAGRLHPLYRGVYAVGHVRRDRESRWMAAVLACGPGAMLSHASAAALWEIRPAPTGPVDVTVPTHNGVKPRKGIRIHRTKRVDRTEHRCIPVTTARRTLDDIRRSLSEGAFARALEQAEILRLDTGYIDADRPGTLSELEDRFLSLIESFGLSKPAVNRRNYGKKVDFTWAEDRLIVEVDGYETHGTRTAFERDRQRDAELAAAGHRVLRFTWRQVTNEPRTVANAIRAAAPSAARA